MSKRVYVAGIGSPEWQARTGHVINERGVPIAVAPPRCDAVWEWSYSSGKSRCVKRGPHDYHASAGNVVEWQNWNPEGTK